VIIAPTKWETFGRDNEETVKDDLAQPLTLCFPSSSGKYRLSTKIIGHQLPDIARATGEHGLG
jgi:hypothetical protein